MAGNGTAVAPATVRRVRFDDARIEMSHGAGGKASRRLIEGLIAPAFANPVLVTLSDAAVLSLGGLRVATTADGYVVRPLQFPGGSIGELAVNGTVNDLAVSGARASALLATFVLEAGLPAETLRAEVAAMAAAAERAGVAIVGGDTKVVEHGACDSMYVTTFGVGEVAGDAALDPRAVKVGDRVLLSGPIGDHGITILLARGEIEIESTLQSDTRSVWPFVAALLSHCAAGLRWMRDPTRGGVATALNELVRENGLGIVIEEASVPLRPQVRGACELLGLDPLHIANEGQFLALVAADVAEGALAAVRAVPGGEDAALIGEVRAAPARTVLGVTPYGGTRTIDMLVGDPLPRIC
ncbi:MAG: hydrogenase expression/formation protein HypE [Candidatus Eremiobacteraeota bacterium]|nr:hydrogenase expression/formation protein HypE [Candidatus Eremiobacteraeota bacterium]